MEIWSVVYENPVLSYSGFGRAAWCLSEVFSKNGVKVNIIYFNTKTFSSEKIVFSQRDGVNFFGIFTKGNLISKRLTFYRTAIELIKNKASRDAIFILHGAFSLPLVRSLRSLNYSVYYETFGTLPFELKVFFPEIVRTSDFKKLLLYLVDIPIEYIFVGYCTKIIVPHGLAVEEFTTLYHVRKDKLVVSPYGQDIFDRFHGDEFSVKVKNYKATCSGKKIILFIGGSAWNRKGAKSVLKAVNEIRVKFPVILIMTGKPTVKYLQLMDNLGFQVGRDLILPGFIDDPELALYYAACDVFFLPSFHEGFSQPIIEVMAYGKPVVTSKIAAFPIVKNNKEGFIVNPPHYHLYAAAIEKILLNPDLYANMSENARSTARRYSWGRIGSELLDFIKKNQS